MIESLFRTLTLTRFFDDYYLRLPLAISEMGTELRALADWDMIESITAQPGADVLVVRSGQGAGRFQ